ncbi:MAG: DUF4339 domain-containing protein, partial [Bacteroidetes bacterium]|nr:DUF4339 domain-containing protein [Bacteroidota bacterium]
MKSYFVHNGQLSLGPYTIEELQSQQITRETPVWKEGFERWIAAGLVEELSDLFAASPPPFNATFMRRDDSTGNVAMSGMSTTEKVGFRIGRLLGVSGLILCLAIGCILVYNYYNNRSYTTLSPPVDPEHSYPANYLSATGTYHKNFWGDKVVIDGSITNSANHTNYKDVVISVTFYSATRSAIATRD